MLTFGRRVTAKVADEGLSFVRKIFNPRSTIKMEDLGGTNLNEVLKDLEESGVKISERYSPSSDGFIRKSASVVTMPNGNTVVHFPTIERSYFQNCKTPNNISVKFNQNGEPVQLVNVAHSEDATRAVVMRSDEAIWRLEDAGVYQPGRYQSTTIDKVNGRKYVEEGPNGASLEHTAMRNFEDIPPIEHPVGHTNYKEITYTQPEKPTNLNNNTTFDWLNTDPSSPNYGVPKNPLDDNFFSNPFDF